MWTFSDGRITQSVPFSTTHGPCVIRGEVFLHNFLIFDCFTIKFRTPEMSEETPHSKFPLD